MHGHSPTPPALLLTGALLFLLSALGVACMPSLQAVGSDDTASDNPAHVDVIEGVSFHAFGDAWDLEPRGLPRRVTPIEIVIVNQSRRDLQVRTDDFRLTDTNGRILARLSPFQVTHDLADAQPGGGRSPLPALPLAVGEGLSLLPAGTLAEGWALLHGGALADGRALLQAGPVTAASGSAADVARGATGRTYLGGARDVVHDPVARPRGRTVRTGPHRPYLSHGARPGTRPAPWWQGHSAYAQPGYAQPGYAQPGYAQPGYVQPGYTQPHPGVPGYGSPGYWHSGQTRHGYTHSGWRAGVYASPYAWGPPIPWGVYVTGHPVYGWHGWRSHGAYGWHAHHTYRWHGYGWHTPGWRTWHAPGTWGGGYTWHAQGFWREGWTDAPPPPLMEAPPEGSADFSQMRISQVSLRDTSLAPGEATGGFLFFERVPRGQEVLLEWAPRSWRAREGLRPVAVRMVAR